MNACTDVGGGIYRYCKPRTAHCTYYKLVDACTGCHQPYLAIVTVKRKGEVTTTKYCDVKCRSKYRIITDEERQKHSAASKGRVMPQHVKHILQTCANKKNRWSEAAVRKRVAKIARPAGAAAAHGLFLRYRIKANTRGLLFGITEETFLKITSQNCHYCGAAPSAKAKTPVKYVPGVYVYNGIDRVDPQQGYVENNIVSCCTECNRGKAAQSADEFFTWVRKISAFNRNGTRLLTQNSPYTDMTTVRVLFAKYSRSQQTRNIAYHADLDTFTNLIRTQCFYCGQVPQGKQRPNGQSTRFILYNGLDRKDAALGYTVDNIVPCCQKCNFAKNTMSVAQFYAWVDRVVTFQACKSGE